MRETFELPLQSLRFACLEDQFDFETTEEVKELKSMIGQKRAVRAVEFGLINKNPGYNIFISGLVGTGKVTYAKAAAHEAAAEREVAADWCYVNNFENPSQPIALSLPPSQGCEFKRDMMELIDNLKNDVSKVFSSEDYDEARKGLAKQFQEERSKILDEFNTKAEEQGIRPQWSSTGFVGLPVIDGKPITQEEFQQLEKEERDGLEKKMLLVQEQALEVVRLMQQIERDVREQLKKLDEKVGLYAAGHLIDELADQYEAHEGVRQYLESVKADVVKNIDEFKPSSGEEETNPFMMFRKSSSDMKSRYQVNLLIDHHETEGAPVVVEINPTYYNLVGRVEYEPRMGVAHTDYTMIKPGAIHRANGGYLILQVKDVLTNLGAWEALKRVLKTKKLAIENLSEQYGMLAMASLKPEPIPVDVKVILIGNPQLYHLLYTYDEDFRKLFKVHADFDVEMENTDENIQRLVGVISSTVARKKLKPFHRGAVAYIVEYSSRLADDQRKLTTRFNELVETICDADVWAELAKSPVVMREHVKQAIAEKKYRSNKYEEKIHALFEEGTLLMDTEGKKVGQVNGLAVLSVGEYMFGKPSRITANTYLGKAGVLNIERETKMSGTSHSKGVLILSGYLGEKYAQEQPLALTASLTFEQLYDGVDGDSASSTELYALLSSLSEVSIDQSIAVTGSVNQKGEVQPIGGVNEKIEGFFAVCKRKGLTGNQGVMIPKQNVENLNLEDEVYEAVQSGQFHIYAVSTIDEGLEVLTGEQANVIHEKVQAKLKLYLDRLMKINKQADEKAEKTV